MSHSVHHLGCLVEDIAEAIRDYSALYPMATSSEVFDIPAVKARVCFFETENVIIEFVQPTAENRSLFAMLESNPGFYHIGKYAENIDEEIERLQTHGYRLVNKFVSPAFRGKHCAFLYNKQMHLVELIEQ